MNERDPLEKNESGPKLEPQEIPEQDKAGNSKSRSEKDVSLSQSKALQCELQKLRPLVERASNVKFDPLRPYTVCVNMLSVEPSVLQSLLRVRNPMTPSS